MDNVDHRSKPAATMRSRWSRRLRGVPAPEEGAQPQAEIEPTGRDQRRLRMFGVTAQVGAAHGTVL
jgi:hypothetical protein